ncbi:MAG: hypothetical protein RMJ28_03905 [Nitrososphaerota archaeon]|nr:hypothetical protein [Candidatus Calditenuaceae archaeon]MDW8073366.1 hypothetical protein [Nitrososphaerota archaeon]
MSQTDKPTAAFIISLAGGTLVLVGGLVSLLWIYYPSWMWWRGMMMPGMMWWMPSLWLALPVLGITSGVIIIVGALAIISNPAQSQIWGALILVFSVIGLFGLGGFIAGSLLGIVGGILALTWKTQPKEV